MPASTLNGLGVILADRTRCVLLQTLMDGRAWTAGELARCAAVAPSTASQHLSRLLDASFVAMEAQGRHRYYRLAGPEIAGLLESLGNLELPAAGTPPPAPRAPTELRYARSCYDHLAGQLGVEIHDLLIAHRHLQRSAATMALTGSGEALLASLGADVRAPHRPGGLAARSCLDWTERRHHLAGAAGAALFDALLERRWLIRGRRPRSVLVTAAGRRGLDDFRRQCEELGSVAEEQVGVSA